MSNSKHTQGSWTCDEIRTKEAHRAWCVLGEGNRKIAIIPAYELGEEKEAEANARLIAAAPEMLAALNAWIKYNDDENKDGIQLMLNYAAALGLSRAAIAKAEGGE